MDHTHGPIVAYGEDMTTTETTSARRLDFAGTVPGFARAMLELDRAATKELDKAGIDPLLRELIKIRASQLNGCAYCLDMHTKDARAAGETEQRIYALPAWRETPFFSARERAALAFTESVTLVASTHVPDADYAAVAAEFSPAEIAALLSVIVAINAWNRIAIASRTWEPGTYEP
jgi:AhpD family alkylhydroperoxidase